MQPFRCSKIGGSASRRRFVHAVPSTMTSDPDVNANPDAPEATGARSIGLANADVSTLITIWLAELDRFVELVDGLTQAQWQADSPCPGWSVGDVVAHVVGLESELHGDPVPQHLPVWDALPHVKNEIGKYIEISVDSRRGQSREAVTAELRELVGKRHTDLTPTPTDPDELVAFLAGMQRPRLLGAQMRILDVWVHEQDIRDAIDRPGGLDTDAAWVTAGRFAAGLPYVWGKVVGAPIGSVLRVEVTGPGVDFVCAVQVGTEGRARLVDDGDVQVRDELPATVSLTCSWPAFAQLCAGRTGSRAAVVDGDTELGKRLMPALAVTP